MKLSVIIPVYNSEKYLNECIDSVLSQDFEDFELLLINDGSTDKSGKICDEYAKKDKRVNVFHKENGGVSSARNLGLKYAKGEWIAFVDSDDRVSIGFFNCFKGKNPTEDWLFFGIEVVSKTKLSTINEFDDDVVAIESVFEKYTIQPHFQSLHSKLYKSSIINKYNVQFQEEFDFGENTIFNLHYLFQCKQIRTESLISYQLIDKGYGLSYKKPNYKYDRVLHDYILKIMKARLNDRNIIDKNIAPYSNRLFWSILSSDLNYLAKKKEIKSLIKASGTALSKSLEDKTTYARIMGQLTRFKLATVIVRLSEFRNLIKANG